MINDHVYIHVPFCSGKCGYCGFYSEPYSMRDADRFLHALRREVGNAAHAAQGALRASTVYVGGGSPSALDASQLASLLAIVRDRLDLDALTEWTVECEPGTFNAEKARVLHAAGVNRISFGAQSFDERVLRLCGRRHSVADVGAAFAAAREAGIRNIGLDLIAGLPGFTPQSWPHDLAEAIGLGARHISVYTLSIEDNTPLAKATNEGRFQPPSTEEDLRRMSIAESVLGRAGYRRYEISNFARPGATCRHNVAVWKGTDYLGFGPAAASRIGRHRRTNLPDVAAYTAALLDGRPPPCEEERLSAPQDACERLGFAFRLDEPVRLDAYASSTELLQRWENTLAEFARERLAAFDEKAGCWRLTPAGRNVADRLAMELLE